MKILAENVAAEQVVGITLVDGLLKGPVGTAILIANIHIGPAGAGGITGEHDPFEDLVRILFHEDAIVESARFALVGIDAEVNGAGMVLGQEGPLEAAGKASAAAAAQAGRLDGVGDLGGG